MGERGELTPAQSERQRAAQIRKRKVKPEQAQEIVGRFQRGETTLKLERERFGLTHNNPIRKALRDLLGPEAYRELIVKASKTAKKVDASEPPET